MEKYIKPCECGSDEFVSKPNQYDIYQIIDGELVLINSKCLDEELLLFCRECSKKLNLIV